MIIADNARLHREDLSQQNLTLLRIGKTLAAAYHPMIEEPLPSVLTAFVQEIESWGKFVAASDADRARQGRMTDRCGRTTD
jgi:hypothetical protein